MLRLTLEGRVTRERGRPPFLFQSEAPGFFRYLTEERGLNKLTVARYLRYFNRLADYLRRIEVTSLRDLSPQLLSSFVVETAPQLARNTRRDLCAVIRTFLRFLYRERDRRRGFKCHIRGSQAVPSQQRATFNHLGRGAPGAGGG
jgi:site-specific recombinase XerD